MACCRGNSKSMKVTAIFMIGITIGRIVFNIELLLVDSLCIIYGKTMEKCGIPDNMRNISMDPVFSLSQKKNNMKAITTRHAKEDGTHGRYINVPQRDINMNHYIGTYFECASIFIHLVIIFKWDRFNIQEYIKALPRMAHFSVWVVLLIIWMVSSAIVESARVGSIHNISSLVFAEMEAVLTVILASAWSFIARQTVYASIIETIGDAPPACHWVRLMMCQYYTSLGLFAMRMTTYFVYDTSLVAQSLSQLQSSSTNIGNTSSDVEENVKEWHSIILVFTCAFRGSLARFFYSKLYQGVMLPKVCDNVPVVIGNREIGVRDLQGGRQHVVPWLTQGQEDRLLASSSHSGFDQTRVDSDDMDSTLQTKELEDIVIVTNKHASQYGTI